MMLCDYCNIEMMLETVDDMDDGRQVLVYKCPKCLRSEEICE